MLLLQRYSKFLIVLIALTLFSSKSFCTDNKKISENLKLELSKQSKQLIWIFFADKGPFVQSELQNPGAVISSKSLERRNRIFKCGKIDETDLPIYPDYISELQKIGFGVKQKSKWFNSISGFADSSLIRKISQYSFVKKLDVVPKYKSYKKIESINKELNENAITELNSLNYGSSYTQLQQINVPALHDLGISGQGITICILDCGFNNLEHEVFDNINIIAAYDFVNNDNNVDDEADSGSGDHGTETLSAIGGYKEGSLIGPAYSAKYILAKTENTDSETPLEEDNWIAAIEWAEGLGVDVTSTSLGYLVFDSPYPDYTWQNMDGNTCRITIAADLAVKKGIVVVNAAGNEYNNSLHNTLGAPADGDSVITVGAVTSTGSRTSFSSVGPTSDGRIKPDVMAMGENVKVASPYSLNGYKYSDGTSFSCPLVAGVAAQILSVHPTLTPMQVRDALRNTASRNTNPDKYYGWGIINALAAATYFGPIPVELTSFDANNTGNKVILNWSTITEKNNLGFEIERKFVDKQENSDSYDFEKIGFINGKGTTSERNSYQYTDKLECAGKYQYRLKQIDLDGTFAYSKTVQVDFSQPNDFILYQNFPNPFNPVTKIKFAVPAKSFISVDVYDILGKKLVTLLSGEYDSGIYEKELDFGGFGFNPGSGIYFIKLNSGGLYKTIKISYLK